MVIPVSTAFLAVLTQQQPRCDPRRTTGKQNARGNGEKMNPEGVGADPAERKPPSRRPGVMETGPATHLSPSAINSLSISHDQTRPETQAKPQRKWLGGDVTGRGLGGMGGMRLEEACACPHRTPYLVAGAQSPPHRILQPAYCPLSSPPDHVPPRVRPCCVSAACEGLSASIFAETFKSYLTFHLPRGGSPEGRPPGH